MNRPHQSPGQPDDRRTRIAFAVITGLVAGAVRAVLDSLMHHLTGAR